MYRKQPLFKEPTDEISRVTDKNCGISEINSASKEKKVFQGNKNLKKESNNFYDGDYKNQNNLFDYDNYEEQSSDEKVYRKHSKEKYLATKLEGNYSTNEFKDLEERIAYDQLLNIESDCNNLNYKLLDEISCSKSTNQVLQNKPKQNVKKEMVSNSKNLPPKCLSLLHNQKGNNTRQMSKSTLMKKTMDKEISKVEKLINNTTRMNSVSSKSLKRNTSSNIITKQHNSVKNLNEVRNGFNSTERQSSANCIYKSPIHTRSRTNNKKQMSFGNTTQNNTEFRTSAKPRHRMTPNEIRKNTLQLDGIVLKPLENKNGYSVYVIDFEESKSNNGELKLEKSNILKNKTRISEAIDDSERRDKNFLERKNSRALSSLTDNLNKKFAMNTDDCSKSFLCNQDEDALHEKSLQRYDSKNSFMNSKKDLLKDFESYNNLKNNDEQKIVNESRYLSFAPNQNYINGLSGSKSHKELSHSPKFLSQMNSNQKSGCNNDNYAPKKSNKENKAPVIENIQVVDKKAKKTYHKKGIVSNRVCEKNDRKSNLNNKNRQSNKSIITQTNTESTVLKENSELIQRKNTPKAYHSFSKGEKTETSAIYNKNMGNAKINCNNENDCDSMSNLDVEMSYAVDSNYLSMKFKE